MTLAGWSVTRAMKNIEYTHRWDIEDFDAAWGVSEGLVQSKSFSVPGVAGYFHLELALKREKHCNGFAVPKNIKIGQGGIFKPKSYFSASLKSSMEETKAAGKLEIIKDGENTLLGTFGDPEGYKFESGFEKVFLPNVEPVYDEQSNSSRGFESCFRPGSGFYTEGSTCLLTLVAEITFAGNLINMGGGEEETRSMPGGHLDFQSFLTSEKHSDILLKSSAGSMFPCHKVVLAASSSVFDRMLDLDMKEAQTGVVEITDIDAATLHQLVEFIYSGQVSGAAYTEELLYAADKYEIRGLVQLCAHKLKTDVSPDSAAEVLILADRHCLNSLKQEVMFKVLAEKTKYLANPKFKEHIKKSPSLLLELLSL